MGAFFILLITVALEASISRSLSNGVIAFKHWENYKGLQFLCQTLIERKSRSKTGRKWLSRSQAVVYYCEPLVTKELGHYRLVRLWRGLSALLGHS